MRLWEWLAHQLARPAPPRDPGAERERQQRVDHAVHQSHQVARQVDDSVAATERELARLRALQAEVDARRRGGQHA